MVKEEERLVYFLDFRESINDKGEDFIHDKFPKCSKCDLNSICAWVYEKESYYNYVKVSPQKLNDKEKEIIIKKIKD